MIDHAKCSPKPLIRQ